jgi:hypothetical protein
MFLLAGRRGRRSSLEFTCSVATAIREKGAPGTWPMEFIGRLAGRRGRNAYVEFM